MSKLGGIYIKRIRIFTAAAVICALTGLLLFFSGALNLPFTEKDAFVEQTFTEGTAGIEADGRHGDGEEVDAGNGGQESTSLEGSTQPSPDEPQPREDAGKNETEEEPVKEPEKENAPDESAFSTKGHAWSYTRNKEHNTPAVGETARLYCGKYQGYYVHNTSEKVIYLTFDEGYENGFTPKILDTLAGRNIKASFFATKSFITKNPELVKRMVEEGHVVASHTVTHRSMYELSDKELKEELEGVEEAYREVTGEAMAKYVRPPKGDYSEKSLAVTGELGYRTIFWSIALPNDWNQEKQPTKEEATALFKDNHHNGAIVLLHAVSRTVAENLDEMLQILEVEGYSFKLITDID